MVCLVIKHLDLSTSCAQPSWTGLPEVARAFLKQLVRVMEPTTELQHMACVRTLLLFSCVLYIPWRDILVIILHGYGTDSEANRKYYCTFCILGCSLNCAILLLISIKCLCISSWAVSTPVLPFLNLLFFLLSVFLHEWTYSCFIVVSHDVSVICYC